MTDIRDVPQGTSGVLFLVPVPGSDPVVFKAEFWRVRVIGSDVKVSDMEAVKARATELQNAGVPYCAFSAGRGTPLPSNGQDIRDLETEARTNPAFFDRGGRRH